MITKILICAALIASSAAQAQIGTRFPSERKVVKDPVTGAMLTFLTSAPRGDSKIYPTHPQWTSDGQWLVFRSNRVKGEAMAVNEATGDLVQVTEGGYMGMLNLARKSMKLYFMRPVADTKRVQIVEVDLARLFADSAAGKLKKADAYQRVAGTTAAELEAGGDMALDADEEWAYFRTGPAWSGQHLAAGTKIEPAFGPRKMGAGPNGIARINLRTAEIKHVVSVPFQIGHIQANLFNPGEIVFCWETGGKSPQRTWTVKADGTGLRPLYPEAPYEWVTHEAVISKDEVAMAIMGHRPIPGADGPSGVAAPATGVYGANPGQDDGWGATTGHKTTAADHPHPTFNADGTRIQIQSAMLSEDNRSMNIVVVPVPDAWLKR